MEPVRNRRNKIVVDAARLHRSRTRREHGLTLLEGPNLLEEAVRSGVSISTVFALETDAQSREVASNHDLRLTLVDAGALSALAGTETPRGPVVVIAIAQGALHTDRDVVVAWGVSDPGNVGTLVRTAAAFGWDYAYGPGSADPWSPKALRAGAGGQFQTSIARLDDLESLDGWHVMAAVADDGKSPRRPTGTNVAVLIGEEASGLPPEALSRADSLVTIRTPGPTESLNASAAAAILVYEMSKATEHRTEQV
jgi:TrmH family RNA methyltransferase